MSSNSTVCDPAPMIIAAARVEAAWPYTGSLHRPWPTSSSSASISTVAGAHNMPGSSDALQSITQRFA
jgi:hypothetical protein